MANEVQLAQNAQAGEDTIFGKILRKKFRAISFTKITWYVHSYYWILFTTDSLIKFL